MQQFLNASDSGWADLEHRARSAAYINFPDTDMPPSFVPQLARVGLKIDPTGATTFFIERGVRYYGANPRIRRWIEQGEISFRNYKEFRCWICSDIRNEFSRVERAGASSATVKPPTDQLAVNTIDQTDNGAGFNLTQPEAAKEDAGERQKLPAAGSLPPDPVANKLIGFLVRQIARNYGVQVESIDAALFNQAHSRLLAAIDQATCDQVIDELLGGPFALASVAGHHRVSLSAGPPITCNPVPEVRHD